jgi:tetratricopeptide (TPR) repeat protein
MTGLIDALIPAQKQAIRLSPRDPHIGLFYSRIGRAHLLQSRIDEAIAWCEKARNATPAAAIFRSFLASAYALKSDTERAAAELAQARRLVGDDRYSSIARLRAARPWGTLKVRTLVEGTYFAGLRKAGLARLRYALSRRRRSSSRLPTPPCGMPILVLKETDAGLRERLVMWLS